MGKTAFVMVVSLVAMMCVAGAIFQSLLVLQRVAAVNNVVGEVKVQPRGSEALFPLTEGTYVRAGDVVRTGQGSVSLSWVDGTRVRLAPETTLKVLKCQFNTATESAVSVFKLDVGKVWVRVRKLLSPRSKFEVITPTATAGVRGTVFCVEVDPAGRTRIAVDEGAVAIAAGETEMLVPADKMALVSGCEGAGVTVTDLAPDVQQSFLRLRDVIGPYINILVPSGSTAPLIDGALSIVGRTEPGAIVKINGQRVPLDAAGRFRFSIPAKAGQKVLLRVEAVDDKGYRTKLEREITAVAAGS
ncbi:MAG: FecR domain-containing protein [Armatimonadetes bacterium]|nr:FecR domain-containing protein [Armatimonadota bacterium]